MAFPPLYLLRHGQSEWNAAGRLQGKFDSDLTAVGRAQATRQGDILRAQVAPSQDISILSSPQGRAYETANLVAARRFSPIIKDERLREISAGSWDGKYLDDIERTDGPLYEQSRNAFELMFLAPDGEGAEAVMTRCTSLLTELRAPTILVTHGATLCVLRGILRGLDFDDMLDLSHEQGCVYALENGEETILR